MQFKRATKEQAKLRAAVFGPSGAGKTYSSLRIASGLGGNIALIDTERGSASKYADRFTFDVLDLEQKDIDTYCRAIQAAAEAGYDVLILDSLSHAWQELLQEIDRLAAAKFRGNTWSAWSEGTPKQRQLIDAILDFPGHVLTTMRSKTEWTQEQTGNGKTKPVRVGLAPEQGKGIEYEFDLLLELSVEHVGHILKDRTGKFQGSLIEKPGEDFGKQLAEWLSDGRDPMEDEARAKQAVNEAMKGRDIAAADRRAVVEAWLASLGDGVAFDATTADQRKAFIAAIEAGEHDVKPFDPKLAEAKAMDAFEAQGIDRKTADNLLTVWQKAHEADHGAAPGRDAYDHLMESIAGGDYDEHKQQTQEAA